MRKALIAFAILTVASVLSIWVFAAEIPEDMKVLKIESKTGVVTFEHSKHAEIAGDCTTCHHKMEGDEAPKGCSECHVSKPTDDTPKLMKAVHDSCWGCHQKKLDAGLAAGPVKKGPDGKMACKTCHVKQKK